MGAYFNPNFRRGEPELASRVRYDHPLAMSGSSAAAIRNHQREKMNALSQGEFIVYVRVEGGLCFVLCNFLVMFLCAAYTSIDLGFRLFCHRGDFLSVVFD